MQDVLERIKKGRLPSKVPSLIGIDFSTTSTKVVRLKKNKGEFSLMGVDLLPAIDFSSSVRRMGLPRNMMAHYGCLAYTGATSTVRVVNAQLPEGKKELSDKQIRELLNIEENFRVSATLIQPGQGRQDSSFLAAAVPEEDVQFMLNMFPSGPPAPASVEISGLAFMQAFLNARGSACQDEAICLLEAGESVSHFVFLNKGRVILVGKCAFGGKVLREKVVRDLGVDDELAATILSDQSINISATIGDVMTPFFKQLSISKDFIERHQGCRVRKIFVSGGLSLLPHWTEVVGQTLHVEVETWSPFENIHCDDPNILPEHIDGQATRFAAAVGAAIGGFAE